MSGTDRERRPRGRPTGYTLCFECKNASRRDVCEWVSRFQEVPGWVTLPTVVGGAKKRVYDSHHVLECPKFERDSVSGGTISIECEKERRPVHPDSVVNLSEAIIERYVLDWYALEHGALSNTVLFGERIHRNDVINFFFDPWLDCLLEQFTDISGAQIREYIGITDEMKKKWGGKRGKKHGNSKP